MNKVTRGDIVELDGLLAVVVGVEGDPNVPEDHLAVWFGDPQCKRISQGGKGRANPEVYTVPTEYFSLANEPVYKH
jgi:hypothetical protein